MVTVVRDVTFFSWSAEAIKSVMAQMFAATDKTHQDGNHILAKDNRPVKLDSTIS